MRKLVRPGAIVLIAGIVGYVAIYRPYAEYKEEVLECQAWSQVGALRNICQDYKKKHQKWPENLEELVGTLLKRSDLTDVWGRKIQYQYPGQHNDAGEPDIYSLGSNPDDPSKIVGSWMAKPPPFERRRLAADP